jgi:hypothetical protein
VYLIYFQANNTIHPYPETSITQHYARSSFEYLNLKALNQVKLMPPFVRNPKKYNITA